MSRFYVTNSFRQNKTFNLLGILLDGELNEGMEIHVPLNSSLSVQGIIYSIVHIQDKEYRLIIDCDDIEEVEIWEMLNINNEEVIILLN